MDDGFVKGTCAATAVMMVCAAISADASKTKAAAEFGKGVVVATTSSAASNFEVLVTNTTAGKPFDVTPWHHMERKRNFGYEV